MMYERATAIELESKEIIHCVLYVAGTGSSSSDMILKITEIMFS